MTLPPLSMTHHNDKAMATEERIDNVSTDWQFKGTWNEFKGKAKQMWGKITDDDLDVAEGNFQEGLGRIQRKTGESMEDIKQRFSE